MTNVVVVLETVGIVLLIQSTISAVVAIACVATPIDVYHCIKIWQYFVHEITLYTQLDIGLV